MHPRLSVYIHILNSWSIPSEWRVRHSFLGELTDFWVQMYNSILGSYTPKATPRNMPIVSLLIEKSWIFSLFHSTVTLGVCVYTQSCLTLCNPMDYSYQLWGQSVICLLRGKITVSNTISIIVETQKIIKHTLIINILLVKQ